MMTTRIVHLIKATRIAGAERHLTILLPGLRAAGIDARLLLLHPPANPVTDFVEALTVADVPVERVPIAHHADGRAIAALRDRLRAAAPHIVHTHLIHADVFGMAAARWAGVKRVVSTRHNDDPFRRRAPIAGLHRALWGMASAGIAISEAIRQFCIRVEGARPEAIHTIHYGLPPAPAPDVAAARAEVRRLIAAPAAAPVIGFVGRLIEQKGVRYAVRAFARLAEAHPAARLLIIGDGDQRQALEAEAGALGVRARTHFIGWRPDAARLMAGFDVFVMPSLWEGFGIVLLEAMAAGVPIVGSAVSAIPEVVLDGETGLLVPPRDDESLAAAIDALLRDAPLSRHLGLMGQERCETHFGAARMIAATRALYDRVQTEA
jgi:glycosyltransferase involved in cell wall biosynthesis